MADDFALYSIVIGCIVILGLVLRATLEKARVPALVGYFALGFALRLIDDQWAVLGEAGREIFEFLGYLGIIVLLFRVGLQSDLAGLKRRLSEASLVWVGNVVGSGVAGFLAAYYGLGWELVPSLFTGVALTATSVGISVATWKEAGVLDSPGGERMLDVAEMDDLSGVVLMALLVSVAPTLHAAGVYGVLPELARVGGVFAMKLIAFIGACWLFAHYAEATVTEAFQQTMGEAGTRLGILGIGVIVAAVAALLGFSAATGAFFAGLMFSRDPHRLEFDASLESASSLVVAFFFISIGLRVDPAALPSGLEAAAVLVGVAVAGKLVGTLVPALFETSVAAALVLGLSMVPRAEITLVIMQHGLDLGDWAVTPDQFAHLVVVSFVTALATPIALRWILAAHPEAARDEAAAA